MAIDTIIGPNDPGIASFESQSYAGVREPLLNGSLGEVARWHVNVGVGVNLPMFSVVAYDGVTLSLATLGDPNIYGILMHPVDTTITGSNAAGTAELAFSGMWDMDALNWDATFLTPENKRTSFEGSKHPTVFFGQRNPQDSAHRV